MRHAEPSSKPPMPELGALHQYLMDLELTPAVRHTLEKALAQSAEQLRQGMAQKAGQAERFLQLGHMAARMVHEIRNPLNAIFLHTDILEEEMQQPTADSRTQMAESLGEIRSEVTRLYAVMQDYLALARLAVIDPVSEELGTFLQDCVLEIQEQIERRGVKLRLEGLARLGRVSIHQGTMRLAILNLIQFAGEVMPAGGTLTLRGRRTSTQVSIEVGYTGSHLQEAQFDQLFEPFHEVGSQEVGLGLYVVREIVAAHHGTVTARNEPEAGTKFILTLPLVAGGATEDRATGQQP